MSTGLLRLLWQSYLMKMAAEQEFPQQQPTPPVQPSPPSRKGLDPWVVGPGMAAATAGGILSTLYGPGQAAKAIKALNMTLRDYRQGLIRDLAARQLPNMSNESIMKMRMGPLWRQVKGNPQLYETYQRLQNPAHVRESLKMLKWLQKRPLAMGAASALGWGLTTAGLAKLIRSLTGD